MRYGRKIHRALNSGPTLKRPRPYSQILVKTPQLYKTKPCYLCFKPKENILLLYIHICIYMRFLFINQPSKHFACIYMCLKSETNYMVNNESPLNWDFYI